MTSPRRRMLLATGAAVSGASLAGCAATRSAGAAVATPFAVAAVTVPIAGSAMAFPVRRIYCIGRNYAAHARETRRDLQRATGDEKKPGEIGKSFDKSAPIGEIHPVDKIGGHFSDGAIWLEVNGTTKQNATLRHMIWSVPEQIARRSTAFELMLGDIIDCGTPENVGPVVRGDVIEIHIDRLPNLSVKIV